MIKFWKRLCCWRTYALVIVTLGILPNTQAELLDPALLPPPYVAQYQAHRMGLSIQADVRFETTAQGATYLTQLRPRGLLSLLRDDRIEERSELSLSAQGLRVEHFAHQRTSSDESESSSAQLDWDTAIIRGEHRGQAFEMTLPEQLVDRSALQLALSQRARGGKAEFSLNVIDLNRIVEYHFSVGEVESIRTPLGVLRAVPVTRYDSDRERTISTWFAIDKYYVPVRLEEIRNGQRISLNIQELRWLDPSMN
ncbi:DUF3108 domain-containing protein [Ectothiorhodosinus mongolicus]|uniref:DUF3108 domain-containing protein n=1 Tax=Ectothiorhodosinus mongolicus TaxID=233100 RepID=UPI000A06BFB1|nr:DUF3108 domain-containing protein [Ectothiorhodosinus mongolicus]ULX56587.1 DUF3108 domain-containing protein [Ectothiorhodosinus mongolicus]